MSPTVVRGRRLTADLDFAFEEAHPQRLPTQQQVAAALAEIAAWPWPADSEDIQDGIARCGAFSVERGPQACPAPFGAPEFWETVPVVELTYDRVTFGSCQFHLGHSHLTRAIETPESVDYEPGAYSYPLCALVEGVVWVRDGHHRVAANKLLGQPTVHVRLYDQDRYGSEPSTGHKTPMNWAADDATTPMLEPPRAPGVVAGLSALVDGRVVGDLRWATDTGALASVRVRQDHQRRGVASRLLALAASTDQRLSTDFLDKHALRGHPGVVTWPAEEYAYDGHEELAGIAALAAEVEAAAVPRWEPDAYEEPQHVAAAEPDYWHEPRPDVPDWTEGHHRVVAGDMELERRAGELGLGTLRGKTKKDRERADNWLNSNLRGWDGLPGANPQFPWRINWNAGPGTIAPDQVASTDWRNSTIHVPGKEIGEHWLTHEVAHVLAGQTAAHGPRFTDAIDRVYQTLLGPTAHAVWRGAHDAWRPEADQIEATAVQVHEAADRALSWDEIGQRHPDLYGGSYDEYDEPEDTEGEGIAQAAGQLAFDRPDERTDDGAYHHAADLQWHEVEVDPRHIDYARHGLEDGRVRHAYEGYRTDPSQVPPVVLVHRHGVYQVADGHHRAEGAAHAGTKVRAYVAHSPHEDVPFPAWDDEAERKGPFHGAESTGIQHQAVVVHEAADQMPSQLTFKHQPEQKTLLAHHPDGSLAGSVNYHVLGGTVVPWMNTAWRGGYSVKDPAIQGAMRTELARRMPDRLVHWPGDRTPRPDLAAPRPGERIPEGLEWHEESGERPGAGTVHATHQGQPVGYLTWTPGHGGDSVVDMVLVHPDWQRKGVATGLWDRATGIAQGLRHSSSRPHPHPDSA